MRILGLDIGTTSIGFALIDFDNQRSAGQIVRLGARIFPEARDPDGTPLNQTRRAKRMMRRQLRRRRERRRSLNELLASVGMLPTFGSEAWRKVMMTDPYAKRAKALAEKLAPHELGRVLYHLAKRRHFKERDLAEIGESAPETPAEDETSSKGKKGAKAKATPKDGESAKEAESTAAREHFVAALKASGQTIGESLSARAIDEKRRGVHATRALVDEEFERIVAAQQNYHAALRGQAFRDAVHEAIFAQRAVFWRKSTLGKCSLMPGEPLCPKGSWLSQERRMLEKVNNLSFTGGNSRPLEAEERAIIIAALRTRKRLTWAQTRAALEPIFKARGESTKYLKFNHETDKDEASGLKGNLVEAELAKIFGARWADHPRKQDLCDFVPEALWQADYGEIGTQRVVIRSEKDRATQRNRLAQTLVNEFNVSKSEAEALVKLHFPQGWEPYSTRALQILLPELQQGVRFGALINGPDFTLWRDENFPQRDQPTGEILDHLPSPRADRNATQAQREEAERIATIRNPTVVRVQNEMRKVVNNLIGLYGKPDLIRVELAREVGKSKREREEMTNGMRDKERLREKARKDLKDNGVADPKGDDVEKWLLWTESGKQCPYTGEEIGFGDIFGGNPRFEIEHIWPRSKSLDNSMRNKTLCRKDVNLAKGARIPFEFFQGRSEDWQSAKDRIWKMVGKGGMAPGKAKRFCSESMPDDFASRQLNDTSYAARQASEFLKRLWPDVALKGSNVYVQPVTGKVTAQLRRGWGLNHILGDDGEKTRADHRHHAVDALVVACADGGYTQRLSRYFEQASEYQRGKGQKPDPALVPPPWASIRADAERAVAEIIVSHRVRKKVSGPLHKETTYGDTRKDVTNSNGTYRLFVSRKPVASLTSSELDEIRDEKVREIVKAWVEAHGGEPKKAFATFPRLGENGAVIRKVRLTAPQKLRAMARLKTGFATTGNNHHIAIYRLADGKVEGVVVSLYEAVRRLALHQPVVQRSGEDGRKLVMTLSLGDTFQIPAGAKAGYWTVKSISGNGQIFSKLINNADPSAKELWGPSPAPLIKLSAKKLSIDPIGRIFQAND